MVQRRPAGEVEVRAAVIGYGCDMLDETMVVGYLTRLRVEGRPTVHATRRFREWSALHHRLGQMEPAVKKLPFPEKEAYTHVFRHTNKSKKLIEKRRVKLNEYVQEVMKLATDHAPKLASVLFLFLRHPNTDASCALNIAPCGANQFRFPRDERVSRHHSDQLLVKLPWGYLAHSGEVCIQADTSADAHMRFDLLLQLYGWIGRLADRLPTFVRVIEQARKFHVVPAKPERTPGEVSLQLTETLSELSLFERRGSVGSDADADAEDAFRVSIATVNSDDSFDGVSDDAPPFDPVSGVYRFRDGGALELSLGLTEATPRDDGGCRTLRAKASCRRHHLNREAVGTAPLWWGGHC